MTPEQFTSIANLFSEAALLLTPTGRIVAANRRFQRLGIDPASLLGRSLCEISATPVADVEDYLRRCARNPQPLLGALTLSKPEGEAISCRCEGALVSQDADGPQLLIKFVPRGESTIQFAILNQKIDDLSQEIHRRKQLQSRLYQQQQSLQVTLSSIGDAVVVTDAAGNVTFLNPIAQTLTGWKDDEAQGQSLDDVFHIVNEQTRRKVDNPATRAITEGVIVGLANHTILIAKDGTERPIDDSAAPLRDRDGEITGAVLVFRDVSERRQVEAALRASEERFRLMADGAPVLIWLRDEHKRGTWFNKPWLEYVGRGMEQEIGQGWLENIHPDDRQRCVNTYTHAYEKQEPFQKEYRLRRHDGQYRWVLDQGLPHYEADGFAGYIGSCTDIDQQKQVEQKLRDQFELTKSITEKLHQSEAQLLQLADAIPQLVWMAQPDGFIDWYNSRWYEYTGTTLEQMQGWGWETVHDPAMLPKVARQWKKSLETGCNFEMVFPLRGADGVFRSFLTRVVPFRDDAGNIVRWFGTNTDISEQKRIQEELREVAARLSDADRRKDEFLATLAHELRNPLAPIRTGVEVMKMAADDPEIIEEARSTIERQAKQLTMLVDDLLDVSRITRGKLELREFQVNLADVMQSAVETSQPLIDEGLHELHVQYPDPPIELDADPYRLAQVFSNLLNNAAKYTPDGGQIWFAARREGDDVIVAVKDTGIGIPADELDHVFDMFAQVDSAVESDQSGLGIGLTLVRSLVEMHEGRISVASAGVNQGSEFSVRLPIRQSAPRLEEPNDQEHTLDRAARCRVLVVDDNKAAVEMLGIAVKMLGSEVRTAGDGREAVSIAAKFRPDIVLMDIGMPKMNGYEAARYLRGQPWGQEMMLVALTGWGQEDDKRRTRAAGFNRHMVKPADPSELRKLIAEVSRSRPARETSGQQQLPAANPSPAEPSPTADAQIDGDPLRKLAHDVGNDLHAVAMAIEAMYLMRDDPREIAELYQSAKESGLEPLKEKINALVERLRKTRT